MKAQQYFPVMLFIMLYKVVPTFQSVDETHKSVTIQIKASEHCCLMVLFVCLFSIF